MATQADILELRDKIKEPTTDTYNDELLAVFIDKYGVRGAAKEIWESKAAGIAHLVDISEGGSSRKMSDIHKNFLAIARTFDDSSGSGGEAVVEAPRTRLIERA